MRTELFFCPGTTSLIKPYNCCSNCLEIGKKGIRVKRKMMAGGIAITKLKAMEEALSVTPTVLTCLIKKFTTSNNVIPLKPGNCKILLFLTIKVAGADEAILFFI